MAKQCNDIKKFKTAEASTKAWFKTRNLLDRFNNIEFLKTDTSDQIFGR